MSKVTHLFSLLLSVIVATAPRTGEAVESWTNPKLKVHDGLAIWIDASGQEMIRTERGDQPLVSGAALNILYDGSGHGRHLVQRRRDAQPRYQAAGRMAVVRFDGKDDHLELLGPGRLLDDFTIFLVVAPRSNPGGFSAFLAGQPAGGRDYDAGFNLDQGPWASTRFETLNLEGRGFSGASDLLNEALPFRAAHTLEVHAKKSGQGGVSVVVDGRLQGRRDRKAGRVAMEDLTLGARNYTNDHQPSFTQGFLDGDIAELLIYDRALDEAATQQVRDYLSAKYTGLNEALAHTREDEGEPLETVANPPPIQMLVPGFTVRELPISLTNINNIKCRADGKLVALAYNGNVYILSDQDGDGLEETAKLFWDNQGKLRSPIGMALTPPGDRHGTGLYIASKGRCSVIVDTDGDDVADREVVVAEGWKAITHAIDALGVAVAKDGSVYFGIGCEDFTNAYLLDKTGKAHYDLKGDRGTIQRVSPDFQTRETVATGVRFPVALAFNRRGDLFATDQEGATWLSNGNPFDELLQIQRGRHYGFPPRHPKHLDAVIDEPSVFDYGPQHQSTCGLTFNESVAADGRAFGPGFWAGDALVCGYSRGKLYRTTLAESAAGYVARTNLIACLNRLTADSCVASDGSLIVATHSGGPDWGSGPNGQGTLYKVSYTDRDHAQPVLAWPESPREVRVAFDRPLNPEHLRDLASSTTIVRGQAVAAGDRFETLRPGYATVAAQLLAPRRKVAIQGLSLTPDRRTLVLATDPQVEANSYALALPGLGRPKAEASPQTKGERGQAPAIDLAYNLGGVQVAWQPSNGPDTDAWSGWLPHLDLAVARSLTAQSARHEELWSKLGRPGSLTLRTQLNLKDALRPAFQPGSKSDAELPAERVILTFESTAPLTVKAPSGTEEPGSEQENNIKTSFSFSPREGELTPIEIALATGREGADLRLSVSWHTAEDARPRSIPLARLLVPWARSDTSEAKPETLAREVPDEWKGGSRSRGRDLFFGEVARCSQCHTVRGEGGRIGPDLSNLVDRDHASVLRDLREPSAAINPDYITYNVALRDGRVLTGPLRTEGETLRIGDTQGHETIIPRAEVDETQAQSTSIMPEGLPALLGPDRLKDLLAFLMEPGLEPAPIRRQGAPPARTKAEVEKVLKASRSASGPAEPARPVKPLRVVLVDGPKDHGLDEHDYPAWKTRWETLLGQAKDVTVSTATVWPSADDLARADVLVWYSANPGWSAEKGPELDAFLARGGGMVYLHFAVGGRTAPEELAKRIGLAWRDGQSKFRHGPLELDLTPGDPITSGLSQSKLKLEDESYWDLIGDPGRIKVLATGLEDGAAKPLLWTYQQGPGRVFCSIPGHYAWTFDDPLFRLLILRGIAWSAGESPHRLDPLATVGAKLAP